MLYYRTIGKISLYLAIILILFNLNNICQLLGNNLHLSKKMKDINVKQRLQMVATLESLGITKAHILNAFLKVPRHNFVSKDLEIYAYDNRPLPIKHHQTISQPYIVAYMLQEANLNNQSRVLEVGTGSGYQAAILAEICREVFSIEIIEELANDAAILLKKLGYKNIKFKIADGYKGWPEEAPFDAIIVAAVAPKLPEHLINQLKVDGIMLIPLQKNLDTQVLVKVIKTTADHYSSIELTYVRFVPLVHE